MGVDIAFWIMAALAVGAAISVIASRDLFRAALLLVLCFFAVAGIYATLSADFLAIAQVLIYVGAVAVLVIFAVMLTRQVKRGNPFNKFAFPAFFLCGLLMAGFIFVAIDTSWPAVEPAAEVVQEFVDGNPQPTTNAIAGVIFDKDFGFLLPFEIAAALLLAAVIGAIALVREK